jgi:hypothetical protein
MLGAPSGGNRSKAKTVPVALFAFVVTVAHRPGLRVVAGCSFHSWLTVEVVIVGEIVERMWKGQQG